MLVEVGVLGSQHRLSDDLGDLIDGGGLAIALRELPEQHAIGRVHLGQTGEIGKVELILVRVADVFGLEILGCAEGGVGFKERKEPKQRRAKQHDHGKHR